MDLFSDAELSQYTGQRHEDMQSEIANAKDGYLLNVNETEYVEYLVGEYQIDPVVLDSDGLYVTTTELEIPAEQHPSSFHFRFKNSVPRQVITYHLPFSGNADLLRCRASTFLMWSLQVEIRHGCICFEIINFRNEISFVKIKWHSYSSCSRLLFSSRSHRSAGWAGSTTSV